MGKKNKYKIGVNKVGLDNWKQSINKEVSYLNDGVKILKRISVGLKPVNESLVKGFKRWADSQSKIDIPLDRFAELVGLELEYNQLKKIDASRKNQGVIQYNPKENQFYINQEALKSEGERLYDIVLDTKKQIAQYESAVEFIEAYETMSKACGINSINRKNMIGALPILGLDSNSKIIPNLAYIRQLFGRI
ncbi:MAG: hypothetical protein P8L75_05605 [Gammaproteobacteria bacterium]|nr:hypothetical protein [Gammaproteobacteria bacterium]